MLRITQQSDSDAAKKYYSSADYYSEGQEIVGSWGGKAAARLGLEGVVDKASFDALCDNLNPRDGKQLTVRTRSDRTVGYDFTLSVPKSVSLLYAMSGDQEILGAFRAAVDETMRDIEAEMKTRVRRNGNDTDRPTDNMVWAEFIHTTSRPVDGIPDPQLHAHCFVFNTTWDDNEQRWKAGQFRDLKRDAPYFQAGFRVRLANKLQDLGFGVERKRDDFEIAGIPASAIKRFSRRTDQIEEEAARKGITDPDRKAELGAKTRESKNHELSWNELRKEWDRRLTADERKALAETHMRAVPYARPMQGEGQAVDYAIAHSFVRDAVVPERKLLTEALKRGVGSVTINDVKAELARRPLIRGEHQGRLMATTADMLNDESRLVGIARKGRGRYRPLGNPERKVIRDKLNKGQRTAIRHVLGSRDLVTIIRGPAGSGKTTLEQELADALAEAGRPLVAIAQTSDASRGVLRSDAKIENADTVAMFLKNKEFQESARGGVVLVDEASLLGTQDMLRLFDAAQGVDARIVLVGDRKQHRAVSAGEPLKLLETKAGLPVAQLTEIVRQSGDYLKATQALSEGNTAAGFAELNRLGWIKEVSDADRYRALAEAYLAAAKERKRNGEEKTAIVISPTHAEGARIAHTIRSALKAEGKLGEERIFDIWVPKHLTDPEKADTTNYDAGDLLAFHDPAPGYRNGSRLVVEEGEQLPVQYADRFEVYRPGQQTFAVGDRLRVTKNGWTKDGKHRVNNGSLLTVQGFTKRGDFIVDHGWVIDKAWGHVTQGYVVTSVTSQSKTVDKVFIGESSQSYGAANKRQFYVSASRGREQTTIFTDSKEELLKAVERPDEPLSATEFAHERQRKPSLRSRLRKHVSNIRRMATFAATHELRVPEHLRNQTVHQEYAHGR
jgi:conjugative relaxase-like TrwC/TraI family protein